MQYLHQVLDILNYLATHIPWDAVVASGVLSTLLVGPQKLVKKWFVHNEQVMILLVGLAGLTGAAIHYTLTVPTHNPTIIALQGLALAFMTQPFYFIVVKPASRKIATWFAARVAEAALLNEAKSAVEPAGGIVTPTPAPVIPQLPLTPADIKPVNKSVVVQDFKP